MGYSKEDFFKALQENSESTEINEMLKEWKHEPEDGNIKINHSSCICGVSIIFNYKIENTETGHELWVGSKCVKRFMKGKNNKIIDNIAISKKKIKKCNICKTSVINSKRCDECTKHYDTIKNTRKYHMFVGCNEGCYISYVANIPDYAGYVRKNGKGNRYETLLNFVTSRGYFRRLAKNDEKIMTNKYYKEIIFFIEEEPKDFNYQEMHKKYDSLKEKMKQRRVQSQNAEKLF